MRSRSRADAWALNAPAGWDRSSRCRGATDHLVRAVRGYIRTMPAASPSDFVTVVIPELLTRRTVAQFLVHREAFLLKTALLFEPGVVVTDVPLVPRMNRGVVPTIARWSPSAASC